MLTPSPLFLAHTHTYTTVLPHHHTVARSLHVATRSAATATPCLTCVSTLCHCVCCFTEHLLMGDDGSTAVSRSTVKPTQRAGGASSSAESTSSSKPLQRRAASAATPGGGGKDDGAGATPLPKPPPAGLVCDSLAAHDAQPSNVLAGTVRGAMTMWASAAWTAQSAGPGTGSSSRDAAADRG